MVGQVLNERYELLEKVGEGGMAIAYRGRDRLLGRTVAVKIMRPELASDASFLARFRREARAAAGITHEHIAAVYDTGSSGNLHYIVMEYVAGESLRDRLRREGPLPLEEALRIATQTAEALEAAHAAGVIHRDIKPHNILLGRDGQVKVTDFGIARAVSSPGQGDTSAITGTVSYVSPEQARGETTGPQGDLYSLGATLFEMLTGKPPFNGGDRLAILHKHVYDRPPQLGDFRPGVPPEVASLVAHCLEKDLSQRFASARELIGYLEACPREEDLTTVPRKRRRLVAASDGTRSATHWLRARAGWIALITVVLVASVLGLAFYSTLQARHQMVQVPDILGVTAPAAQEMLRSSGLGYRPVGSKPSDAVPEDAILTQDPAAGIRVARDTVVKVVLSKGTGAVVVPNVTKMSVSQAERNLGTVGLEMGEVQEQYNAVVPPGYVAATLPEAGARVVPGTAVDVIVSLGKEPAQPGDMGTTGPTEGPERVISFVVPSDVDGKNEVTVTVQLTDDFGTRTLYEGKHKPGDRLPTQTFLPTTRTTARILVDGKLRAERQYTP